MDTSFEKVIKKILIDDFQDKTDRIFISSQLLHYIDIKTRSANKGSKARGSFANLYAIYVLVEDYLRKDFRGRNYREKYEGAKFSDLFRRQRELPFGGKLQNHALNNRLNWEYRKYFPTSTSQPIVRNGERYWFNEDLLTVDIDGKKNNIAQTVLKIIDEYVQVKQTSFKEFIRQLEQLKKLQEKDKKESEVFIFSLLAPNVDARIFEIVSYSILKYYYHDQIIYFGFEKTNIQQERLTLYKTGRTNANDGGIDFVMRPLGRFFQVTETTDVRKYFLDIDKIERYPITFVIKSEEGPEKLKQKIKMKAKELFSIRAVVDKYMNCIEEIINLSELKKHLSESIRKRYLSLILDEIIKQSKTEFNLGD